MKCVLYGTIGCLAAAVVWLGWEQFHLQQRLVALQGSQPTVLRGKGDSTASSIEDLKARFERTRIDLSAALQGIAQTSAKVDTLQQAMEKLLTNSALYLTLQSNARKMIVDRYEQKYLWELLLKEYHDQLKAHAIIS